jgi:hypothetical protein
MIYIQIPFFIFILYCGYLPTSAVDLDRVGSATFFRIRICINSKKKEKVDRHTFPRKYQYDVQNLENYDILGLKVKKYDFPNMCKTWGRIRSMPIRIRIFQHF